MSDEQLRQRLIIKQRLTIAGVLLLLSVAIVYFWIRTNPEWSQYQFEKDQESSIQAQIDSLTNANNQLLATIEENGKELVSFSEDKIKYINLASELSLSHSVRINKLTVSDVWQEGEMSVMTTSIEVEGDLSDVRRFIDDYCSTNYTNRINVVSCRPSGRYTWLQRGVDGQKVLGWFDLSEDEALYQDIQNQLEAEQAQQNTEAGIPVASSDDTDELTFAVYWDPELESFVNALTGVVVSQEEVDEMPITLDRMFAPVPMKVYLVIDFLGRA